MSKPGAVVLTEIPGRSFHCEFCQRTLWSGMIEGNPSLVHEEPPCASFMRMRDELASACLARQSHEGAWAAARSQRESDPRIPHVGSHPSRARALGRADREDGLKRRSTAAILEYLFLTDLDQQSRALAEFELRAAYDAAYDLGVVPAGRRLSN